MEGRGFESRSFAPVKVGDEIDVTIEAVGAKGDGIAKKEGFVLFVPGVQKGDNVKIRVTRVLRKVGFAEVVGGNAGGSKPSGAEEEDGEEEPETEAAPEGAAGEEPQEEEAEEDSEDFGEEK